MGYVSAAQRMAVHAHKADGGAGHPKNKKRSPKKMVSLDMSPSRRGSVRPFTGAVVGTNRGGYMPSGHGIRGTQVTPFRMKSPLKGKISPSCKARAKKKFKVWPSAYASGWGVRCTQGKLGKKKK
jgi:hypothetical protein